MSFVKYYHKLNKKTINNSFTFHSIADQLKFLNKPIVVSHIYLKQWYDKIPIDKMVNPKTAFVLPFGHHEFKRLPFWPTNALEYFNIYATRF